MTVGELIETLNSYPHTVQIVIEDADTQWMIDKIHHDISVGRDGIRRVVLSGFYSEMKGGHNT